MRQFKCPFYLVVKNRSSEEVVRLLGVTSRPWAVIQQSQADRFLNHELFVTEVVPAEALEQYTIREDASIHELR